MLQKIAKKAHEMLKSVYVVTLKTVVYKWFKSRKESIQDEQPSKLNENELMWQKWAINYSRTYRRVKYFLRAQAKHFNR